MKKFFGIALFALAGVLAAGCAADDGGEAVLPGEPVHPQSVDAVDLTLNPGWEWRMEEAETLFVLRSAEELSAHVTGGEGLPADVDFTRYTVLFASGRATNGIVDMQKSFESMGDSCLMTVDVYLNETEEAPLWNAAMLVPALADGARVDLQVNAHDGMPGIEQFGSGLHLEVEDLVLNLGWKWRKDQETALYIIRSKAHLLSHLALSPVAVQEPANIDFTKDAVLFVPGVCSSNVRKIERTLYVGTRGFMLEIDVYPGMLTVIENWEVAVVVPLAVANSNLSYVVETKFE